MATSLRGKLTPKVIKVKLKDSVSVSSGGSSRSSSGSSSKPSGVNKSIQLKETLRVNQQVQTQSRNRAPPPQISASRPNIQGVPREAAGFLAGAKATARLRSQTEEERRKEPALVQATQGFAEGVFNTASAVGAVVIAPSLELKGLIEGKGFGQSKDFVDAVLKESRPSSLGQTVSQLNPDPTKREKPIFDITGISRSAGEVLPFFAGAKGGRVSAGQKQSSPQFGFTKTEINLGKSISTFKDGPFQNPSAFQLVSQIQSKGGIGKTKLRDNQPPRSPFQDDVRTRGQSELPFGLGKQFKSTEFNLGRTISKQIGGGTQKQSSGLQTILKQTGKKTKQPKSEIDILRQGPRFKETKIKAGQSEFNIIRFPPKGKSQRGLLTAGSIGLSLGAASGQKGGLGTSLIPTSRLGDPTKTRSNLRQSTGSRGGVKFKDETSFLLTPGTKLGTPTIQTTTPLLGNPPQRPQVPVRPFAGFAPFGRPISLSSFGGGGKSSSRTVFGAFAISENINIGRLPGELSEFSTSSKVFGKLDKRDKAFQNAIFGKPRRKSKGKKTSKRKRKR